MFSFFISNISPLIGIIVRHIKEEEEEVNKELKHLTIVKQS